MSRIRTNPASATVLTPPVLAGDWYMSEGCCADDTHHRRGLGSVNGELAVPQRFAIDFYKVDAQHRTWIGDPSKLSSYLTYRQPVLAAGPGTVVASRNDLPNNPDLPRPPKNVPLDATVGNFVIEKLDSGLFVLYGHMDPGSVVVQAGQHVAGGSKLGLIGTSGNSTTPHVHFQILTEADVLPHRQPAVRLQPVQPARVGCPTGSGTTTSACSRPASSRSRRPRPAAIGCGSSRSTGPSCTSTEPAWRADSSTLLTGSVAAATVTRLKLGCLY